MSEYIFFDGKIVPENEAVLSVKCKVVNYGLGCFEGIRAYYDEENDAMYGFMFEKHYKRLLDSCSLLNIDIKYSVDELIEITKNLIIKNNIKGNVYIRPLAFKGANTLKPSIAENDKDMLTIYVMPLNKYTNKEEMTAMVSSWRRLSDNAIPARAKITGAYVNSALASYDAQMGGFDEAILLKEDGYVAEGSADNVFLVRDNKLITPSPSEGILQGITRDIIIRLAREEIGMEVVERNVARTELYSADEVLFSGTAMEVAPVVEIDRRKVGNGKPGETYKKLKDLFEKIGKAKVDKYSDLNTRIF